MTGSGTVERTVALLSWIAGRDGDFSLSQAGAALGLSPSTVHRLLELLAGEGMVDRDARRHRYRAGLGLFRMSAMVQARFPVRRRALPIMRRVVELCDETCLLCLYLPQMARMIFAERVDSTQLLRYRIELNVPLPVGWGASGRSFLAYLPDEEVARVRALREPSPVSGAALPSKAALEKELAAIRARGYAITRSEKIAGAVGIAAPIFDADGAALGSLGVTVPEIRFRRADEPRLARLVVEQAFALSQAMGYEAAAGPRRSTRRLQWKD